MALSKTDKNTKMMKEDHGTTCLITQAGKSDKLLDNYRKQKIRLVKKKLGDWEI